MSCRYCRYEAGHSKDCPAFNVAEQLAVEKAQRLKDKANRTEVRYTGREFEYDLLGRMDVKNPKYLETLKRVATPGGGVLDGVPHVNRKDAVDLVMRFQLADPSSPKRDFLRELVIALQDELNIDPEEDHDAVRGYSALDSPLDKFFGIDGFVLIKDGKSDIMITLDPTLNKDKQQSGHKADIIIGDDLPDANDDPDGYVEGVEKVAGAVLRVFDQKKDEKRPTAAE